MKALKGTAPNNNSSSLSKLCAFSSTRVYNFWTVSGLIRNQFGHFQIKHNIMMVFFIVPRYLRFVSVIIKIIRTFAQLIARLFHETLKGDAQKGAAERYCLCCNEGMYNTANK